MKKIITGNVFGGELAKLWGFEHCTDIKIYIPANGVVKITAEFNCDEEKAKSIENGLKKYHLEEDTEQTA